MGNLKVIDRNAPVKAEGIGDIAVGTSQVEIVIANSPIRLIRIQADNNNTGTIFIGMTGVLNDGTNDFARFDAGDETYFEYEDTVNAWYAISDTAAQTINVGALL